MAGDVSFIHMKEAMLQHIITQTMLTFYSFIFSAYYKGIAHQHSYFFLIFPCELQCCIARLNNKNQLIVLLLTQ